MPGLKKLLVKCTTFCGEHTAAALYRGACPNLTTLDLSCGYLDDVAVTALVSAVKSGNLSKLSYVDVTRNFGISSQGVNLLDDAVTSVGGVLVVERNV